MRRIRARRRANISGILVLALCLVLFLEARIEAFVPQLKGLAEAGVGKALGDGVSINIGSIDGGIINPITLNDISVKNKGTSAAFAPLAVTSIRTSYRLWDVYFGLKGISRNAAFLSPGSSVCMSLVTDDLRTKGFIRLDGGVSTAKVRGAVEFTGAETIEFSGTVSKNSFDILITPARGSIRASGNFSDADGITANLKIKHIGLYGLDVTCDAVFRNRGANQDGSSGAARIEGEVETGNLILNHRPFPDLRGRYKVSGGNLETELCLGDGILRLTGNAELKNPYGMDMTLTANNLNLSWLAASLGNNDISSVLSGTLNGKFDFKGGALFPKTTSVIEMRKGCMGGLDFEILTATLKGDGPVLRIEDSRITRESGYFVLAGELDLRKMGKAAIFSDIKLISDEKAILWDGWNATDSRGVQEFRMTKRINDDINVDFKKFVDDQAVGENLRDKDQMRLEYKLHPNESLKMMFGNDDDFVGLEHKDKF